MKKLSVKKIATIILVLSWVGLFVATHIPMPKKLPGMLPSDKHIHYVAYFYLTMVFIITLKIHKIATWKVIILALIIMPAYGAFDELAQPLVNRNCEFYDWFADTIGAITATGASLIFCVFPKSNSACKPEK